MTARCAVVGHVEWVTFHRVDRPLVSGGIVHASSSWSEAAGGGAVAAAELARLAGRCTLYTALGDDEVGRRIPEALARLGISTRAAWRAEPQRQATTLIDPDGRRSIVVHGPAQTPTAADDLDLGSLAAADAVYFCKGDAGSLRAARQARVLVGTARVRPVLQAAGVVLDALVLSDDDPNERYAPGQLDPPPRVVVRTQGARGGAWETVDASATVRSGRYAAVAFDGERHDDYGAGDSFAAGLTFALGAGLALPDALARAATSGATALGRRGAHG